jgi:hypothetical protein
MSKIAVIIFIVLMVMSRVIPPNLTPTIVLSLLLGEVVDKKIAVTIFLASQMISDVFLSYLHHYPLLGGWTFFVYSGLVACILIGRFNLLNTLSATILFWVWTNLGVFLFSGFYLHNGEGFIRCYSLALPFLQYSFCGSLFYYFVIKILALDSAPSNRVFFTAL